MKLDLQELDRRKDSFCRKMDSAFPAWNTAVFISKANQYYFTGTMQNALLIISRSRELFYFVRASYDRAVSESPIDKIYPMTSYRDAAAVVGEALGNVYVESDVMPLLNVNLLKKNFSIVRLGALDTVIKYQRAVKSEYELRLMEESGRRSNQILSEIAPSLLVEGISEAEYHSIIFERMIRIGHAGIVRFNAFQVELAIGQITFGDSSLFRIDFDGPTGGLGNGAFAPSSPSPERTLKKGDLVLVDLSLCYNGYHSDTTQIYCFGAEPPPEIRKLHRECIDLERRIADRLRPGKIPSKIYADTMSWISPELARNFMGFGKQLSKFVGHGIGLMVDEYPVLAKGFDIPLEENMTLAVEPKAGIEGYGIIGVEDTFVVSPQGGRCITGGCSEIVVV